MRLLVLNDRAGSRVSASRYCSSHRLLYSYGCASRLHDLDQRSVLDGTALYGGATGSRGWVAHHPSPVRLDGVPEPRQVLVEKIERTMRGCALISAGCYDNLLTPREIRDAFLKCPADVTSIL
jgi:hypothetical protein